jgi:cellulose synthase (UDP-forming)
MAPFAFLAAVTILGVALHAGSFGNLHGSVGYTTNVIWSLMNAAMLALAALVCIEPPRRRRDERFVTCEPVRLQLGGFSDDPELIGKSPSDIVELACELQDLSLGGARLVLPDVDHAIVGPATLLLYSHADETTLHLPIQVVTRNERLIRVQFLPEPWIRHALIRKLFTGEYHKDVERISVRDVFVAMLRVLTS